MRRALVVVGVVALGIGLFGNSGSGAEPQGVQIVKTSPEYGKTIPKLNDLIIEITFDRPMDPATQEDVTMDQRGAVDAKGEPIEFNGTYTWVTPATLRFKPTGPLKADSVYQVTVWSAKGKDGSELQNVPYRLPFSTAGAK